MQSFFVGFQVFGRLDGQLGTDKECRDRWAVASWQDEFRRLSCWTDSPRFTTEPEHWQGSGPLHGYFVYWARPWGHHQVHAGYGCNAGCQEQVSQDTFRFDERRRKEFSSLCAFQVLLTQYHGHSWARQFFGWSNCSHETLWWDCTFRRCSRRCDVEHWTGSEARCAGIWLIRMPTNREFT